MDEGVTQLDIDTHIKWIKDHWSPLAWANRNQRLVDGLPYRMSATKFYRRSLARDDSVSLVDFLASYPNMADFRQVIAEGQVQFGKNMSPLREAFFTPDRNAVIMEKARTSKSVPFKKIYSHLTSLPFEQQIGKCLRLSV